MLAPTNDKGVSNRFHSAARGQRRFFAATVWMLLCAGMGIAREMPVAIDPAVGKLVDRNGVPLAEFRSDANGTLKGNYPLGAFAAQVLHGLDPRALPKPGEVVYLTLDARVQAAAERVLRKVGRGAAVVIDPDNGDILAMASVPSFDPNAMDPAALEADRTEPLRNRAINAYVPGSTYKMVTALAGLRAGIGDQRFDCNGGVNLGDRFVKCWIVGKGTHGTLDLEEAMKVSCGPFFFQYANASGIDQIEAVGGMLGLGQPSGIPLAGEHSGVVDGPANLAKTDPQETWRPALTANVSIGQGRVLATPLQLASVAATIANGGTSHIPRLVRQVVKDGGASDHEAPVKVRAVLTDQGIDAKGIEHVRRAMWRVVNEDGGTARKARLPDGSISGKTGTAQNWRITSDGPRMKDNNVLFVGFAPYDAPKYAFTILVQGGESAGQVAAPLAADIMREIDADAGSSLSAFSPAPGSFEHLHAIE